MKFSNRFRCVHTNSPSRQYRSILIAIFVISLGSACSSGSESLAQHAARSETPSAECTNCSGKTWKGYYRISNQQGWFTRCGDKKSYAVRTGVALKALNKAYYKDRSGPDADLLVMITATAVSAESRGLHPPSTELHIESVLRTLPGSRCEVPAGISSKLAPESTSGAQPR